MHAAILYDLYATTPPLQMIFSILFTIQVNQKDHAGWAIASRIWECQQQCVLNESVDLSLLQNGTRPSFDVSVVNVFKMQQSMCSFDVMNSLPASSISNGVFILNATVDMSLFPNCKTLQISVFDQANGLFNNLSVTGFVNVTNLNASKLSSAPLLSNFFGRLQAWGDNRNLSLSQQLANLSSSLQIRINGVEVEEDY